MRIGIVTIYESITNLGSFLQAYAMKTVLEQMGHEVFLIQNVPTAATARKRLFRLNPKRELFLRVQKTGKFCQDMKRLRLLPKEQLSSAGLDLLLYGSDEIWNLENPYFQNDLFWGLDGAELPRLAYAVSVGAMGRETMAQNMHYFSALPGFQKILVRDEATRAMLTPVLGAEPEIVCDPTLLLPLRELEEPVRLPKKPYLLVYTYGLDAPMERAVTEFARKRGLEIVTPCFWHLWADRVVECRALQFSALIRGAACVFTSTFHGAIFTLLNHQHCAILPVRPKVADVVRRLGEEDRLIEADCTAERLEEIMDLPFDSAAFEQRLETIRADSMGRLGEVLQCLEN